MLAIDAKMQSWQKLESPLYFGNRNMALDRGATTTSPSSQNRSFLARNSADIDGYLDAIDNIGMDKDHDGGRDLDECDKGLMKTLMEHI